MRLSKVIICSSLLLLAPRLRAEECPRDPNKSINQLFLDCSAQGEASRRPVAVQAETNKAKEKTKEAVAEMATSPTAPDGFSERVNDAIADFLPLFQFAVNSVTTSDDKKSVVVKFNTKEIFGGRIAGKATVAEPQLFPKLEESIIEGAREAESKALLGEAGDFSDITASFDWGLRRTAGNLETARHLYGREFETYDNLVEEMVQAFLTSQARQDAVARELRASKDLFLVLGSAAVAFDMSVNDFGSTRIADLEARIQAEREDQTKEETEREAKADRMASELDKVLQALPAMVEHEVDARLTIPPLKAIDSLIANQPELVVKGSYRFADEAVGQREGALTVSYEMGTDNFNRVLKIYRELRDNPRNEAKGDDDLRVEAYNLVSQEADDENRVVFTATFKKLFDYDFQHPYQFETVDDSDKPVTSDQVAELEIPSSQEWHVSALWSKPIRARVGDLKPGDLSSPEKRARLDFSLEGIWIEEDRSIAEALRRHDRVVARLTFTQPLPNNMSIPFSIVYANRPEFLKDQGDQLSAHIAISYKFLRDSDRPQGSP